MNRRVIVMVLAFGVIFGSGIGATIEHHFNKPVVVMSPICSKKEFQRPDENVPIIPDDPQDQHRT